MKNTVSCDRMRSVALSALSLSVLLAACGGPSADTTKPTVSLTAAQSGTSVTLTASASDASSVKKVEFYRAGQLINTDEQAPFTYSFPVTSADNGQVSFSAKAYDPANNVGESSKSLNVYVAPTTKTLHQGVWGWAIGNPNTQAVIDSGAVIFDEEIMNDTGKVAAGVYVNRAESRSGVSAMGPISATGNLETVFTVGTTTPVKLYFVGADSNNALELYEGKKAFAGLGALVDANNNPTQEVVVALVQVSDQVPSGSVPITMTNSARTLAIQALSHRGEFSGLSLKSTSPLTHQALNVIQQHLNR